MEIIYLVVTDIMSSGKTEFIRAISETDVVSTKIESYPPPEFGRITIENNLICYLFGLFPNTIQIWNERGTKPRKKRQGCIITLDSSRPKRDYFDPVGETEQLHKTLRDVDMPAIISATKQDRDNALSPDELRELYAISDEIPIYPVSVTTDSGSVKRAIIGLLEIMPQDDVIQQAIAGLKKFIPSDTG